MRSAIVKQYLKGLLSFPTKNARNCHWLSAHKIHIWKWFYSILVYFLRAHETFSDNMGKGLTEPSHLPRFFCGFESYFAHESVLQRLCFILEKQKQLLPNFARFLGKASPAAKATQNKINLCVRVAIYKNILEKVNTSKSKSRRSKMSNLFSRNFRGSKTLYWTNSMLKWALLLGVRPFNSLCPLLEFDTFRIKLLW